MKKKKHTLKWEAREGKMCYFILDPAGTEVFSSDDHFVTKEKLSVLNGKPEGPFREKARRIARAMEYRGNRYYGDDPQITRDMAYLNKRYEHHGGWDNGVKGSITDYIERVLEGKKVR